MTMMILLLMLMGVMLMLMVMMVVRTHGNHAAVLGRDKTCLSGGKTTISILEEKYGSREYRLGKLKKEIALEHFELQGQN